MQERPHHQTLAAALLDRIEPARAARTEECLPVAAQLAGIVELVPAIGCARGTQRAVGQELHLPVAEMQAWLGEARHRRQEPGHGMAGAVTVDERTAEHHVAAALAVDERTAVTGRPQPS